MRKCPQCGGRRSFIKHWFGRYDRCRTCGIGWHREHGFELGPIALNVVLTFGSLAVIMVVAFVATAPDYNVAALMGLVIGAAVVLPLIYLPFTNTLWLAFDLAVHRPDERELAAARAAVEAAAAPSIATTG
ncbi:MAG: hypothetical protein RJA49_1347 [Actinomycetota bacterium]